MGVPRSAFNEERRIFDADVEKAPPSLPSVSGPSVDRHSSRPNLRASLSPARSSSSRHNDRYDRDHRRVNNDYVPRGEKRRRSREDDARSHRVHYEAGGRDLPIRRPRVSYADIDRSEPRESLRDEPVDDRSARNAKRSRTRSRSPPPPRGPRQDRGGRGGGRGYYDDRRGDGPDGYEGSRDGRYGRYGNEHHRSRDRSGAERGENPAPIDRARRDAEARSKDSNRRLDRDVGRTGNDRSEGIPRVSTSTDELTSPRAPPVAKESTKPVEPLVVEIEEPVDESKLIEERRKKREAIKAKYRGQGTPLLATALGIKDAPAASPTADSPDPNSPCKSCLPIPSHPPG